MTDRTRPRVRSSTPACTLPSRAVTGSGYHAFVAVPREKLTAALAGLREAFSVAVAEVQAAGDPDQELADADLLAEEMVEFRSEAARVRALAIRHIWQRRELSLAALAGHIGVSKARAQKYIESTRDEEER